MCICLASASRASVLIKKLLPPPNTPPLKHLSSGRLLQSTPRRVSGAFERDSKGCDQPYRS